MEVLGVSHCNKFILKSHLFIYNAIAGIEFIPTSFRLEFNSSEQNIPLEIFLLPRRANHLRTFSVNLSFDSIYGASGTSVNVTEQEVQRIRYVGANPVKVNILPTVNSGNSGVNISALTGSLTVAISTIIVLICVFIICVLFYKRKKSSNANFLLVISPVNFNNGFGTLYTINSY